MDARNTAAAIVFLVALSLSFGYLRVQATGSCSQTTIPITVTVDTEFRLLLCPDPPQSWTIGSDICNIVSSYEPCPNGTHPCNVPKSDFLERGPTIVCCGGNCFEFKIDFVINHISVPPVIQAGKEVTIYATFAAKPLPPTFPSLIVDVINEPSVPTIVTSMQIVPSPTNDTEYIILHTFVVPLDFNKTTQIRPRFLTPPEGWRSSVELTFEPIGVVFPEVQPPTTTDAVTTTDPSVATTINPTTAAANVATTSTATGPDATATIAPTTTNVMDITTMPMTAGDTTLPGPMTVEPPPGSTCIGPGHVAAAAVGGTMAAIIVFVIFVCVFIWYKRRKSDSKETTKSTKSTSPHQPPPYGVPPRPNNMDFSTTKIPHTLVTQHSTPTPGYGETTHLLPGSPSSRNHSAASAVSSPAPVTGAVNPGYHSSPTTPYSPGDPMHPLLVRTSSSGEPSPASAASTGIGIEAPPGVGNEPGSSSEQAKVRDQDGINANDQLESSGHIYDEVRPRRLHRSLGPLPEIPEQTVSYNNNMHQLQKEPHLLINKPKTIEVSVNNEDMLRVLQLNQNNLLRSHPHPTTDISLEDGIPVYDRSNDGEGMILPTQPEVSTKV